MLRFLMSNLLYKRIMNLQNSTEEALLALFNNLQSSSNNAAIQHYTKELQALERSEDFLSSLVTMLVDAKYKSEARVWAASYLKKMIVKAREATIEQKMKWSECIIVVLKSDTPIRLKKIALSGVPGLLKSPDDPNNVIVKVMATHLSKQLQNNLNQPALNPLTIEYQVLYGQLMMKTEQGQVDLDTVCKLFEFYLLSLMRMCILTESVINDAQTTQQQQIRCVGLLKESTLLLRIFFQREDFSNCQFFKTLLTSQDVLTILEKVLSLQTKGGFIPNSIIQIGQGRACQLINESKSNAIAILYILLKTLIILDDQDGITTDSKLYQRAPVHLDLFLASSLNVIPFPQSRNPHIRSIIHCVQQMLRYASIAIATRTCYDKFSIHRGKWVENLLMRLYDVTEFHLQQFVVDPQNYLIYAEQMVSQKPDLEKLRNDEKDQEELVLHMTAGMLLNRICRFIDGVLPSVAAICIKKLCSESPEKIARSKYLIILGVIKSEAVKRQDTLKQILAYFKMRTFVEIPTIAQRLESCLHSLVFAQYFSELYSLSHDIILFALEPSTLVLAGKHPAVKNNPGLQIAVLYLLEKVFKDSTHQILLVVHMLIPLIENPKSPLQLFDTLLQLILDSKQVHSSEYLQNCHRALVSRMIMEFTQGTTMVLSKCWQVILEICTSKLLVKAMIPALENNLKPLLDYIIKPVKIDIGDDFVIILKSFISISKSFDEFMIQTIDLLPIILRANHDELQQMLPVLNLYLVYGGKQFNQEMLSTVANIGLSVLNSTEDVSEVGKIEACILLSGLLACCSEVSKIQETSLILTTLNQELKKTEDKRGYLFQNLLACMALYLSATWQHLSPNCLSQIFQIILSFGHELIRKYPCKVFGLAMCKLIEISKNNQIFLMKLDTLLQLGIIALYRVILKDSFVNATVSQHKYEKIFDKLKNPITQVNEFSYFSKTLREISTSESEIIRKLSPQHRHMLNTIMQVQSVQGNLRQIVKVKKS